MTWSESMKSCQLGHENAALVEIISTEVFIVVKRSAFLVANSNSSNNSSLSQGHSLSK